MILIWLVSSFIQHGQGDDVYSPASVRKSFCNTFGPDEQAFAYDLSAIDFDSHCAKCIETDMCPAEFEEVLPTFFASFRNPLCCDVQPHCECPEQMARTSCTLNAVQNAIPVYNLFTDTSVVWGDAWQQHAVSHISRLMISVGAFARVVAGTHHYYTVQHLLEARKELDAALRPVKYLQGVYDFKDVKQLDDLISYSEKFLEATKQLQPIINKLALVKQIHGLGEAIRMKSLVKWDSRLQVLRYRSAETGRFVKASEAKTLINDVLKEVGGIILANAEEHKLFEAAVESLQAMLGGMAPEVWDILYTGAKAFIFGPDIFDKVGLAISGTRYLAKSVAAFAQNVKKVAAKVRYLEDAAETLSSICSAMDLLFTALAVGQIGEGMYEDRTYPCQCCTVANSAMVNLPSRAHAKASEMPTKAFQLVFPRFPWRAHSAANTSAPCLLMFGFDDSIEEHQWNAASRSVLKGVLNNATDVVACFVEAFVDLAKWSGKEVQQQHVAVRHISRQFVRVFEDVMLSGARAMYSAEEYNDCWFFCDGYYQDYKRAVMRLQRVKQDLTVLRNECLAEFEHMEKAFVFWKRLWAMETLLIDIGAGSSKFRHNLHDELGLSQSIEIHFARELQDVCVKETGLLAKEVPLDRQDWQYVLASYGVILAATASSISLLIAIGLRSLRRSMIASTPVSEGLGTDAAAYIRLC